MGKTISNPKVFTLDNQVATIKQGEEVAYQATGSEGADTSFKEATLNLTVTPSIIGDGNVLLEVSSYQRYSKQSICRRSRYK